MSLPTESEKCEKVTVTKALRQSPSGVLVTTGFSLVWAIQTKSTLSSECHPLQDVTAPYSSPSVLGQSTVVPVCAEFTLCISSPSAGDRLLWSSSGVLPLWAISHCPGGFCTHNTWQMVRIQSRSFAVRPAFREFLLHFPSPSCEDTKQRLHVCLILHACTYVHPFAHTEWQRAVITVLNSIIPSARQTRSSSLQTKLQKQWSCLGSLLEGPDLYNTGAVWEGRDSLSVPPPAYSRNPDFQHSTHISALHQMRGGSHRQEPPSPPDPGQHRLPSAVTNRDPEKLQLVQLIKN